MPTIERIEQLPIFQSNTPRTIRFRIVSLVSLVMLPLVVLCIWVMYNYAAAKQQLIEQQRFEITNRVSAAVDREIAGPLGMLTGLAGTDDLANDKVDDFRGQALRLAAQPDIVRIWAFDRNGQTIPGSDTMPDASVADLREMAILAQVFAGSRAVSPVYGKGSGGTRTVIAVPSMKNKTVAFGVAAELSVARLGDIFASVGMEPSWPAAVVDRNNRFVARSLDAANRLGSVARPELGKAANAQAESGSFDNVTFEGVASANAYHRSDLTGWTTVVAVPRSELATPLRRAIALILVGGAIMLGLALLLSSILARRISEPIRNLSRFTAALATGRPAPPSTHHLVELDEVRSALVTALAQSAHLSALVVASGDAIISVDLDGKVRSWNKGAEDLFGYSEAEIIGKPKSLLVPESRAPAFEEQRLLVMSGETIRTECERRRRDGRLVPVSLNIAPIYGTDGKIVAISSIIHDITDRKASEEHTHFLMREIAHRSKNQLAIIQSIAGQTARRSRTVDDFVASFRQRLQGLAASHDLLVRQDWRPVLLADLIKQQLAMFDDRRSDNITATGPEVRLPAAAAEGIGLALHELATNSAKYGALSVPTGHVSIDWSLTSNGASKPELHLEWRDTGGPAVEPPSAKGFGSQVLETLVARQVGGQSKVQYKVDGLHWTFDCKLPT